MLRYQIERGNARESLPLQELAERLCNLDPLDNQIRATLAMVHFCQSEIGLLTSDSDMILTHAEKGMKVLQSIDDKTWRTVVMFNNLSLSNIMIGK